MTINKITESAIEIFSLDELKHFGFPYFRGFTRDTLLLKLIAGEVRVML
jgi:hypothetical protein